MSDLGTLGGTTSYAFGVNNSNQVVGSAQIASDASYHAFLYTAGKMVDLNSLCPRIQVGV
jgi:probable HAF family extracellular repeat protein